MARKPARFAPLDEPEKPAPKAATAAAPPAEGENEAQPSLPMRAPKVQRSRKGRKALTVYLDPNMAKAIKILGVEQERHLEEMAAEAFNDLLRKHGRHPIA